MLHSSLAKIFLTALSLVLTSSRVYAVEPGLGPRSILIGQSAAFTGAAGELGREYRLGSSVAFSEMNAQGGVNGRQIITIYRDDAYDPKRTLLNTQRFISNDQIFALFGYVGTAPVVKILPLINQNKLPLVAPLSGAQALRFPVNPHIHNIRSSYHQELTTLVSYLQRYRRESVAVIYQQDGFGQDVYTGLLQVLSRFGLKPVATESVSRSPRNNYETVRRIVRSKPESILLASSPAVSAQLITTIRSLGSTAQIFSVSFGGTALSRLLPL